MPHHHILLASRQLWPNILGLVALQNQQRPPDRIWILHTDDVKESAGPARRLQRFVEETLLPNAVVSLKPLPALSPEAVEDAVAQIRRLSPADARWTINATGGLKILFAGLLPQAEEPDTEVFYREISGKWIRLLPPPGPGAAVRSEVWDIAISTDHLPVLPLVETQFEAMADASWKGAPLPDASPEEILEAARAGLEMNWAWREMSDRFPWLAEDAPAKQGGFLFERFFGAMVRPFAPSPRQAVMNAQWSREDQPRNPMEELDLVVNAGGRIVVFDLKLSGEDKAAMVDQFAKVAADIRRLGGLGAVGVLVRPGWEASDGLARLAEHFGLKLWTQKEMPHILPRLAEVLGGETPADLHPLDALLRRAAEEKQRLFAAPEFLPQQTADDDKPTIIENFRGWVDLLSYVNDLRAKGIPLVIKINESLRVVVMDRRRLPLEPEEMGQSLRAMVKTWGCRLLAFHASRSKGKTIVMLLSQNVGGQLQEAIKQFHPDDA